MLILNNANANQVDKRDLNTIVNMPPVCTKKANYFDSNEDQDSDDTSNSLNIEKGAFFVRPSKNKNKYRYSTDELDQDSDETDSSKNSTSSSGKYENDRDSGPELGNAPNSMNTDLYSELYNAVGQNFSFSTINEIKPVETFVPNALLHKNVYEEKNIVIDIETEL